MVQHSLYLHKMSVSIFSLLLACFIITRVNALYGRNTDVIELTPSNFQSRVMDSDDVWIVEFFAPWCGHCKSLVSEYSRAATALKGVVKVAALDADEHKSLASQYGVRGFPTIKIFSSNKQNPSDYNGQRTADGFVDAGLKEVRRMVDDRLGGKKSSSGGSGSGDRGKTKSDPKDVVELTDSNFKELVIDSKDMWLVEFYAPWCGHCQRLAPEWQQAASELKGKVKLGTLDATVHTIISQQYEIKGFPTIKFFPSGVKDSNSAEEYNGGRTASDIVAWASEKAADSAPPPEVVQLTSMDVLKETCENHPLCVISILPHILDCQSQCRNAYIKSLQDVGNKYRKNGWGWGWAEAMAQPELEDTLGIGGFGYPAMAVINVRKMKYSILKGSFSFDGISEFVRTVLVGRGSSAPVKGAKLPELLKTESWDGKDGEMPVEEELDLSDISLDDDDTEKHTEL